VVTISVLSETFTSLPLQSLIFKALNYKQCHYEYLVVYHCNTYIPNLRTSCLSKNLSNNIFFFQKVPFYNLSGLRGRHSEERNFSFFLILLCVFPISSQYMYKNVLQYIFFILSINKILWRINICVSLYINIFVVMCTLLLRRQ
jgi:hypothetical protein